MGIGSIPVVLGQKPEPRVIVNCKDCAIPLEFVVKAPRTNVRCYMCKATTLYDLEADASDAKHTASSGAGAPSEAGRPSQESASKGAGSGAANGSGPSGSGPSGPGETSARTGKVKDTEYYDLLGVSPEATPDEIKKGYRKMAIIFHPDKNPGDETANDKFKKIAQAYQTLSDPQQRQIYDQNGPDMNSNNSSMNPEEFFRQMFGGDRFEDYIGTISLAKLFGAEMAQNPDAEGGADGQQQQPKNTLPEEVMSEEQHEKRVMKLTQNLKQKLSTYVDNVDDTEATDKPSALSRDAIGFFEKSIEAEAETLRHESHGTELLHALGYTYTLKAQKYLSRKNFFGLGSWYHTSREKLHILSDAFSTVSVAYEVQSAMKVLQESEKAKETAETGEPVDVSKKGKGPKILTDDERAKMEATLQQKGLTALWMGSKLELEGVVREVCDNVLYEKGVETKTLDRRARALKILGRIFSSVKSPEDQDTI